MTKWEVKELSLQVYGYEVGAEHRTPLLGKNEKLPHLVLEITYANKERVEEAKDDINHIEGITNVQKRIAELLEEGWEPFNIYESQSYTVPRDGLLLFWRFKRQALATPPES